MQNPNGEVFLGAWCAVVGSAGMSTGKEVRQPVPVVVLMLVLLIFCMSSVVGTISKPLLMSIVTRSVRCTCFGAFRPSCMCCVRIVRSVVAEFLALKPCLDGDVGRDFGKDQPLKVFERAAQ